MPGGSHYMGAKNSSTGKRLLNIVVPGTSQAQANRPFRSPIILGLDSPQPAYHIARLFKYSPRNVLVVQSPVHNIQNCHVDQSPLTLKSLKVLKPSISIWVNMVAHRQLSRSY